MHAFDFDAEHGEPFGQFLRRPIEIDVLLEPIESDFHERKLKLLQETHIVFVEQPDVVDPVADHGDAFDAETEGPAGPDFRIVADVLEHLRMHHAAAGDFEPFLAHLFDQGAGEIDFEARFGVGEIMRAETDFDVFAHQFLEDEFHGAFQVADGDVLST